MTDRRRFLAAGAAAVFAPAWLQAEAAPPARLTRDPAMTTAVPTRTLNRGAVMPLLGFGSFAIKPEQAADVVATSLGTGFRLIDTAANYRNETQVGAGIARSGVARSELFVTTKLWIEDFGFDQALRGFDASMAKLKLDYLDLYLLHWPVPMTFERTTAAYRAAERLLADGPGPRDRWHMQHGLIVIPRSKNPAHIAEKFDVLDFALSDADMAAIDGTNIDLRGGPDPETFDLTAYRKLIAGRAGAAR